MNKQSILFVSCITVFLHTVPFKLGVENIPDSFIETIKKKSYKIGLITNQTGVTSKGMRSVDFLREKGVDIVALYAAEHGFQGTTKAELAVANSVDVSTGIPIISLYEHGRGRKITNDTFKNVDMLFFDIQDSGMRHYTYISTLFTALEAAGEYGKHFVVLDRPNPLGALMEGPLVDKGLISFISIAPIPLRHGMTVGELAWYFNTYFINKKAHLHVIPMSRYSRKSSVMGEFKAQLSPNIKTLQSCFGYSFLGLLGEIKPFDVGINSDLSFQCILLPENLGVSQETWKKVQDLLQKYNVKSNFYKRFHEAKQETMYGLRFHINAIDTMSSFNLFLALLQLFKKEGVDFSYSPSFDKAVGTARVRHYIAGTLPEKEFFASINRDLYDFYGKSEKLFIYKPFPHSQK